MELNFGSTWTTFDFSNGLTLTVNICCIYPLTRQPLASPATDIYTTTVFLMPSEADEVASVVLELFGRLPAKRKPTVRENGTREWVPLAGIVARHGDGSLKCLALAYVLLIFTNITWHVP